MARVSLGAGQSDGIAGAKNARKIWEKYQENGSFVRVDVDSLDLATVVRSTRLVDCGPSGHIQYIYMVREFGSMPRKVETDLKPNGYSIDRKSRQES